MWHTYAPATQKYNLEKNTQDKIVGYHDKTFEGLDFELSLGLLWVLDLGLRAVNVSSWTFCQQRLVIECFAVKPYSRTQNPNNAAEKLICRSGLEY